MNVTNSLNNKLQYPNNILSQQNNITESQNILTIPPNDKVKYPTVISQQNNIIEQQNKYISPKNIMNISNNLVRQNTNKSEQLNNYILNSNNILEYPNNIIEQSISKMVQTHNITHPNNLIMPLNNNIEYPNINIQQPQSNLISPSNNIILPQSNLDVNQSHISVNQSNKLILPPINNSIKYNTSNNMPSQQIHSIVQTNNILEYPNNLAVSVNNVPSQNILISQPQGNIINPNLSHNFSILSNNILMNQQNNLIPKQNYLLYSHNFGNLNNKAFQQNYLANNTMLSQSQNIINNNNILQYNNMNREPNEGINLGEFKLLKEIGKGTFGDIYKVQWIVNNKYYALKKENLTGMEVVAVRKRRNEAIKNFIRASNCRGVVNLYGNLVIQTNYGFQYYELMELCDKDFEQEIKERSVYNNFYTEEEIYNIMLQLISTLAILQKMHITHRDIKPQNILISNGIYKLCDFGDIRVMERDGVVVQRVRGSELYMSPILFNGLRNHIYQVRHNTYKSDVFSLGMCFLLAACLSFDLPVQIRELSDMSQKEYVLNGYLAKRYSPKLIKILLLMIQTEEMNRPDFILLENAIRQYGL